MHEYIVDNKMDVMALTETWLSLGDENDLLLMRQLQRAACLSPFSTRRLLSREATFVC